MNCQYAHAQRMLTAATLLTSCFLLLCTDNAALALQSNQKELVNDQFTSDDYKPRNAARGDWKIKDGTASVTQDDAMFKKFHNHGPIMIYTVAHDDATAVMDVKPEGCRTVVFTMDAESGGHAFRVKLRTEPKGKKTGKKPAQPKGKKGKAGPSSTIVTYAAKVGDAKAKQITLNDKDVPKLVEGEWNRLEVTVKGDKAVVKLRGKTIEVQHEQIDQKKKVAKLGFSFGSMAMKNFKLAK